MGSYRDANGVLSVRRLGVAEYSGYIRKGSSATACRFIDRRPDFDGWEKLTWIDYDSRKRDVEANTSLIFEGDVTPWRRFLTDNNCKLGAPKRVSLDLEADSRVPFRLAVLGEQRLLSWALVDEEGHRLSACLEDDHDDAEAELWSELWKQMGVYDQVAAWGGDRYDFAVLKERCQRLATGRSRMFEPMWEHRRRLLFVDHLAAFKRHHMAPESGEDKASMKLGSVGMAIVGEGKDEVPPDLEHITKGRSMGGSSWDLWAAGGYARQSLVKYMIQDAALLPKIEAATGYLALQQSIAEVTLTPVNSHGLKPMAFVDAYLLKMAREKKTHLPSKKPPTGLEKEAKGAYVFECKIKGIAERVHICDFKSLYPTIARTFNVGSETKGLPGCTAANGVTFSTEGESMIASFFRTMMHERDWWKGEMKKFPPGTPDWKNAERKSKAFKIANNSGYGVFGCAWFRLYDVQIVEAITLGGQLVNRETAALAETKGWSAIAGDTDSLFIQGPTVDEFGAFVKECNAELYPRLLSERGCRPEHRCIELAYEKCFKILVAPQGIDGDPAQKRYFGSYLHYGGKPGLDVPKQGEAFDPDRHSRPEIRGLEYMRGDSLRLTRQMQEELIWKILAGERSVEALCEWIKAKREAFFRGVIEPSDIVKSQSISKENLDDYKTNGPHVRIARELQARGQDVGEGTRIAYITVDGSVSPATVIPVEDFDGVTFDRFHYWNKQIYPATLRVLAGAFPDYNWSKWLARRPKPVLTGQLSLVLT